MSLSNTDQDKATSTPSRSSAAVEILHSIFEEVEKESLLEKRGHLEELLQRTPSEWFHLGAKHDHQGERYQELRDLCIKLVLLLIEKTNDSVNNLNEGEAGADLETKYKEHARLAHAAMTVIGLLLSKLSPVPKGHLSRVQEGAKSEQSSGSSDEPNEVDSVHCTLDGHQDGHDRLKGTEDVIQKGQEQSQSSGAHPVISRENESHFSVRPRDSDTFLHPGIIDESLEERLDAGDSEEDSKCSDRLLRSVMKPTIGTCIILCASHARKRPWTSKLSLQAAKALSTQLITICGCNSTSALLMGCHHENQQHGSGIGPIRLIPKGAFGPAMVELKKQLTRNNWKKNPAAMHTFTQLLAHMKHPYVGEQLDHCLPPSLLFVDDYQMENKVMGIQCLKHIIENVDPTELRWYGRAEVIYEALHPLMYNLKPDDPTELRWYGRAEVIYEALHPLMYNHKPDLIDALYPCLLAILKVVEKDPKKSDQPRKLGRYDKALQIILTNMEGEQRIPVRQANARHLPSFISAMGITILWHIKRLVRIIIAYLETSDGLDETGRILTLRILQAVIVQAWPRMMRHCVDLMKALLKLLLDISRGPSHITPQVKDMVRNECIRCMVLLKRCCGTVVEDTVNMLLGSNLTNKFLKDCLENVKEG